MRNGYDVIVIGAGLGGLSAATMLARHGLEVLLLERHNVPGGYATSFVRGRYEFEVALHELSGIGQPEKPGPLFRYLQDIGVTRHVDFLSIPHLYRSVFPGLDLRVPAGWEPFVETLCETFPQDSKGIRRFLERIRVISREFGRVVRARGKIGNPLTFPLRFPNIFRYLPATWAKVLQRDVSDPAARAVLSQYWGYVGLGPAKSSFLNFALTLYAYAKLYPSYPAGRSQALSSAFLKAFEDHGGAVKLSCEVDRILIESDRVVGVVTEKGDEYRCDAIVSNADPLATCRDMLGDNLSTRRFLKALAASDIAASTINVYIGVDASAEKLGLEDHEIFINDDFDLDSQAAAMHELAPPKVVAVTNYNAVYPQISPPGTASIVICGLMYAKPWAQVSPEKYVETKNHLADSMIEKTEKVIPGLRDNAEVIEVSTPLTNMRFANTTGGSIYGFDAPPWDNMVTRMNNRGPHRGLYFAGAWTQPGGGFEPTMMSGQMAGAAVLRHLKKTKGGAS